MKFQSLPNDKTVDLSKMKAIADHKMKLATIKILVFDRFENIVGKGENAGYKHFLLFPQCFQKPFIQGTNKPGIAWEKG